MRRGRGSGRRRWLWGWYLSRRCRWLARGWRHDRRRRNLDRRRKLNALRRDGHFSNRSRRSGCWALYRILRSSRRSGARRRGLLLQLGDFASKMGGLPGLLLTRDVKVLAQSSVFPQQVKCEEGGNDQKDSEEDSNQH